MIEVAQDVFGSAVDLLSFIEGVDKNTPAGPFLLEPLPEPKLLSPSSPQAQAHMNHYKAILEDSMSEALNSIMLKGSLMPSDPVIGVAQHMLGGRGKFVRK